MPSVTLYSASDVPNNGYVEGHWSYSASPSTPDGIYSVFNAGGPGGADGDTIWFGCLASGQSLGYCLAVNLQTPSDPTFSVATAVTIYVRGEASSSKHSSGSGLNATIFQSNGTTALTNWVSTGNLTTSWATYSLSMSLTGSQTLSAWTNAQLWVEGLNGYTNCDAANVIVTYSQGDTDDSGEFGGTMGTMNVAADFIVNEMQQTSFIGYEDRRRTWRPSGRLISPVRWAA